MRIFKASDEAEKQKVVLEETTGATMSSRKENDDGEISNGVSEVYSSADP